MLRVKDPFKYIVSIEESQSIEISFKFKSYNCKTFILLFLIITFCNEFNPYIETDPRLQLFIYKSCKLLLYSVVTKLKGLSVLPKFSNSRLCTLFPTA